MNTNTEVKCPQTLQGAIKYFSVGDRAFEYMKCVRWPDGKQLQRVGLLPDIEVKPTIAGIRAGRDEVLERAVQYAEHGQ